MNIDEFDHVEASPSTALEFTISDRPVLPTHAKINYWNSWEHDSNNDNLMQIDEVEISDLVQPNDLALLQGTYEYDLDTSQATDFALLLILLTCSTLIIVLPSRHHTKSRYV